MRRVFPIFGAVAIVMALVWLPHREDDIPPRPLSVYDSALLTLRDFVAAGDDRLGFANVRELDSAHIDLTQGVRVYFLRNDTSRSTFNWYDTLLMDLGRVVYPVYTKVNGSPQLRSCITFDSIGGVHPVMFDDSTLLLAAVRYRRMAQNRTTRCGMIMVPSLGVMATVAHTTAGDSIVESDEVRRAVGHRAHGLTTGEFVRAVRDRMQSR